MATDAVQQALAFLEDEATVPEMARLTAIRNHIASLEQQLTAARGREGDAQKARRYEWLRDRVVVRDGAGIALPLNYKLSAEEKDGTDKHIDDAIKETASG